MPLCPSCFLLGYCCRLKTVAVTRRDLANPDFIYDVRAFAHTLSLSRDAWHNALIDWYRDYCGLIVDASDEEIELDISVFETRSIRDWFRDTCCTAPKPNGARYVRREAQARFAVMATILKSRFPVQALMWGVRAANDNDPPEAD